MTTIGHADDDTGSYDAITLVLAIFLLAAPWILGFSGDRAATASSIVAGLALSSCALVAISEFTRLFEEIDIALGALTAAAPWLAGFAHDRAATAAHLFVGLVVAAFSVAELYWLRRRPPQARM